jgi:uncharacterized protein YndB with AHSA1/START domain
MSTLFEPDAKTDLVLERVIDVPVSKVWAAWTQPEHVCRWFTPHPWSTAECEIDLRPGGIFKTVMRSPEGELHPHTGCWLEVVPQQRLVWTDALGPGFRPAPKPFVPFFITAIITLRPEGSGTRYTATCLHAGEAESKQHAEMGFFDGWGAALDQLVAQARLM